ncbi:MAG: Pyridine nucleotide-disulfide oxidoreductase, FAD/NAD(P)-binding domain-containing protein [Parcubacteria group bacterium GW2011_GWC2_32_10]|nr:MAG: Pyridine nucleotide-disulfide oxidoreductase, FAD/NAD(P)-binding domain-containing protein [Parcubacteria group bacterium GW2011_GWC2_32_10]
MIYDLIIIGGGPGGITAGIYAGRQRIKTLLVTKEFGGQMAKKATEICNFPGFPSITGIELMEKFVEHLKCQQDVEIKTAEILKVEPFDSAQGKKNFIVTTTENETIESKSVIISTGADPRPLEAKGEKEFIGKGVGYCVTCDGPLFKNKVVAIVGGGNAGFEAGLFMARYASKVYILEFGSSVKADLQNQEDVKKSDKIEIITSASVKEIKGEVFVKELFYEDQISKEIKNLKVDGIFIEIGSQPSTSFVSGLVDFNERDEIKVDFETFATKTPGLFAAGDVNVGKYKQIVTAAGEGCKAVLAVYDYLRINKLL